MNRPVISEADLHAWVDGQLPAAAQADVDAWLREHPRTRHASHTTAVRMLRCTAPTMRCSNKRSLTI